MEPSAGAEREQGFLLIADMEGSTESKFRLGDEGAFAALREHNRRVIERCHKAEPVPGTILNSLGDAVVAKFPAGADEDSRLAALASCLATARALVQEFEGLTPLRDPEGGEFPLRTKLTLQFYDAFLYGRRAELAGLAEELVGPDIDVAFRVEPLAWRLQVLVTERFLEELLRHSQPVTPTDVSDTTSLVRSAHDAREEAAEQPSPTIGIAVASTLRGTGSALDYWITDAREIARLKGIPDSRRVFLIAFESPALLAARGQRARLAIKVRQDHHAVVLASVQVEPGRNDEYIDYVLDMLRDPSEGSRLESELTLCAAAKLYGEYDFFFRVSCVDDESLRRFFEAIRDPRFGVNSIEVRSTVADRFYVTPHYERVLAHFRTRPHELVLAWFRPDPGSDLFLRFTYLMDEGPVDGVRPVEILETGEVIHRSPVYALFLCDSLAAYSAFFEEQGLNPTACRSQIGHTTRPGDVRLRYSLMSGVWVPRRRVVRSRAAELP